MYKTKIIPEFNISFADCLVGICATTVYFVGCKSSCPECQNKKLQDFNHPEAVEITPESLLANLGKNTLTHLTGDVTLLGGEPLDSSRIEFIRKLLRKNIDLFKPFQFTIFTGYDIEYVKSLKLEGWDYIKVGKYMKDLPVPLNKAFRTLGSSNQEVYDSNYNLVSRDGTMLIY